MAGEWERVASRETGNDQCVADARLTSAATVPAAAGNAAIGRLMRCQGGASPAVCISDNGIVIQRQGGDMHGGIAEDWRTRRGLPSSGVDESGQPIGPSEGQIVHQLNQSLVAKTPYQLANTPPMEFAAQQQPATPSGPTGADYERAARFLRSVFARFGYTYDFERDRSPLGRLANPQEVAVADRLLSQVLAVPGVQQNVAGPGGRGIPGAPGRSGPTLAGRVRMCNDQTEYSIKRYQLLVLVVGDLPAATPQLDGWVRQEWPQHGITPGGPSVITDQERRAMALVNMRTHVTLIPGFYLPLDDAFYLAPGANLSDPATQDVARHETAHLLGGRERTRDAFLARIPDRRVAVEKWGTFEEGMAELINLEASGRVACGPNAATPSGYAGNVATMCRIMADPRVGRATLINAYFTGNIPDVVFSLLGVPAQP
jgi:hypothetical protein